MTFVPIHPEVGIVFKKKDGTTFTQWYSSTENNWQSVNEWIADALFFNSDPGNIMAIVRMK